MFEFYTEKEAHIQKWILTGFLCFIWYVVSIVKALLAKYILTIFPQPLTLSMMQLVSISVYSIPLLYFCKLRFNCINKYYFFRFLVPLSILKAATTASSHLAIWSISVSYSQIMRASMPVFTAIFCRIILRTTLKTRSYLTLIPIVVGVCITTVTETDFKIIGMLCGMLATCGSSLQTIFNKMLMEKSKIHSFQLTALLGWVSAALFFFVWFSADGIQFMKMDKTSEFEPGWWKIPALLILDGFVNFIQNVVAFAVLYLITPTSYAVGNISKRPMIIAISILVFKNAVSWMNILGIIVTVIGASLYTYFEVDDEQAEAKNTPKNMEDVTAGGIKGQTELLNKTSIPVENTKKD